VVWTQIALYCELSFNKNCGIEDANRRACGGQGGICDMLITSDIGQTSVRSASTLINTTAAGFYIRCLDFLTQAVSLTTLPTLSLSAYSSASVITDNNIEILPGDPQGLRHNVPPLIAPSIEPKQRVPAKQVRQLLLRCPLLSIISFLCSYPPSVYQHYYICYHLHSHGC
jgi:hypothetical protein